MPPLRERIEDLPKLVLYFVGKYGASSGGRGIEVRAEALTALAGYPWPGNVRELENVVERVIAMNPGDAITVEALPDFVRAGAHPAASAVPDIPPEGINLEEAVNEFEKQLVDQGAAAGGGAPRGGRAAARPHGPHAALPPRQVRPL